MVLWHLDSMTSRADSVSRYPRLGNIAIWCSYFQMSETCFTNCVCIRETFIGSDVLHPIAAGTCDGIMRLFSTETYPDN
jgi:hypothetical protein